MRKLMAGVATVLAVACGGNKDVATTDTAVTGTATGTVAGDSAGMMAPGTGAGTTASLSDANTGAQLDSVATAARGGLTSLAPAVAIPLIQSIEDKLDNSNDPALTDIAKDLEKLREELNDDTPDGPDIANILERLGPKVTNVASKGGAASGTLTAIGSELSKAATALKGGK
ncbi:hypothetical protein [Roseisolibacter sp. H3M3-2]|uniref:hypothetical protein n=1 Tax=Roseisolibacter sp. H3M3-2 TaxID=3031323 RepID=UPI0023D9CD14|nr:hypothetical protein [Roseisolibacter sp. H3M3-2]MDF1505915.1 hypothetical protein [Roseisolibacter sp. H3M3-2]